jgi:hypothetical protein
MTEEEFLIEANKLLDTEAWMADYLQRGRRDGTGKIVLWIKDRKGIPWVGESVFNQLAKPILYANGELSDVEKGFLVTVAMSIPQGQWHPIDYRYSGQECKPHLIGEAVWTWLDAGSSYFHFFFSPNLEI